VENHTDLELLGSTYQAQEFIESVAPLSLFVDTHGSVTWFSTSMGKSVPMLEKGVALTEVFVIVRPAGLEKLQQLNDAKHFVVLAERRSTNRFKCTKITSKNNGGFMLACSPMLNERNSPTHYNLSVSDFAPHDIIAEYLFVMKANQMGMREANELINTITNKNKELELARKDLINLNNSLEEKANRTEESLKAAESELLEGEKLTVLGRLAAGVAHEMNTPLGAITSSADNLSNILRAMFKDGLKDADHSTVMEACKLADDFTAHDTLTSRQERTERKALEELLRLEYGAGGDAAKHASTLVECGVLSIDKYILDHIYGAQDVEMALGITSTVMKIRKSVSTIEVAAQKAAKVVRALKSYVRNDNVDSATVFDVSRSINDVLLLFGSQLKKGIELHVDMDDQLLIQGNESEISKVWSNLIANAVYAMQNSGNLWIAGTSNNESITLTFSNDGPAIPKEVMNKLFEPFYSTKPIGDGSGLGLSIVSNIVASMNGSIEVDTGDRTTFTITLPKAAAKEN
jgi:signal transduction histidine kinase